MFQHGREGECEESIESMAVLKYLLLLLLVWRVLLCSSSSEEQPPPPSSSIKALCSSTPFPETCTDSLKLSISITLNPTDILKALLLSLDSAMSAAAKLAALLSSAPSLIEPQRGALQDCIDLHKITVSVLTRTSAALSSGNYAAANTFLSAAATNKNTCMEGLDTAAGPQKAAIVAAVRAAYAHVANCLSMLAKLPRKKKGGRQRGRRRRRRWLEEEVVVTVDGEGGEGANFSTVGEAVAFAPAGRGEEGRWVVIKVRAGVYEENVEIPIDKTNLVIVGQGSDVTFITGNRSVVDGWTTFRSATLAVMGDGFLARDITFANTAGPDKHQAVALRVNADRVAVYRCAIVGYQDTLYVHSFRQFYRETYIYGTIDFIFGNAAAVLQSCYIVARPPLPSQSVVVTAQSRETDVEDTGISIQNSSVLTTDDFGMNDRVVRSYLGRPWRECSRTVYINTYMGEFIDPAGWAEWVAGRGGLDRLYYGEYRNNGPGSGVESRVSWPGFHLMEYEEALVFSVVNFIGGEDDWLDSTTFPYDDWI